MTGREGSRNPCVRINGCTAPGATNWGGRHHRQCAGRWLWLPSCGRFGTRTLCSSRLPQHGVGTRTLRIRGWLPMSGGSSSRCRRGCRVGCCVAARQSCRSISGGGCWRWAALQVLPPLRRAPRPRPSPPWARPERRRSQAARPRTLQPPAWCRAPAGTLQAPWRQVPRMQLL